MHKIAEAGVASHWLYKEHRRLRSTSCRRRPTSGCRACSKCSPSRGDSVEFLEHLKVDLFPDEVYVFTPKGKIMSLPRGATAVDFAYAVHTDIGNRCVAAKINHELVPLRTELKNGDRVEIITAAHAKPNPAWLNYVVTGKARSHIRHFLKTMQYEESAQLGERLLNQALAALKADPATVGDAQWDKLLKETSAKSRAGGPGRHRARQAARDRGRAPTAVDRRTEGGASENSCPAAVVIRGSEGMAVQFANCCRPIPGDPIIGFIKKGQGMVVHTHDCPVVAQDTRRPGKMARRGMGARDQEAVRGQHQAGGGEPARRAGQGRGEIGETDSNIDNVSLEQGDSSAYTIMHFTLQVHDRLHLARIMRSLRRMPEVIRIWRLKG